jgi:hypothetical protein
MKHKVSEIEGALLDLAVAMAEGYRPAIASYRDFGAWAAANRWSPSANWIDGGPIIEREKISVGNPNGDPGWAGTKAYPTKPKRNGTPQWRHHIEYGATPLIAAMRCYVVSKLGDEVEMP